jgi:hypothetical protein
MMGLWEKIQKIKKRGQETYNWVIDSDGLS